MSARRGVVERALGRVRRALWPTVHERSHRRWVADRGDERLRLDYPLGPSSVVLDAGGYRGDWAAAIAARSGAILHVFEPVAEFAAEARRRLAPFPQARVHAFGLAGRTGEASFDVAADGSSALRGGGSRRVLLRAAAEVLDELNLAAVDLMKINIEGGEYELLEHLLDRGLVPRFAHLQVQFHDFVPGAPRRMEAILARLARTHEPMWRYPFVWESWRRRDVARGAEPAA